MKRVIKFKGKRLADGQWVYGHLAEIDEQPAILTGSIEWIDGYELRGICWELIDPSTVCQFTGLTDAQGKEIYEGDILRISISKNGIAEVKWYAEWAMFVEQMKNSSQWYNLEGRKEVIGNIHDNPELLEGGSK